MSVSVCACVRLSEAWRRQSRPQWSCPRAVLCHAEFWFRVELLSAWLSMSGWSTDTLPAASYSWSRRYSSDLTLWSTAEGIWNGLWGSYPWNENSFAQPHVFLNLWRSSSEQNRLLPVQWKWMGTSDLDPVNLHCVEGKQLNIYYTVYSRT